MLKTLVFYSCNISNAPVLRYYKTKGVTIQADASQTGLGDALMQDGQPISYETRAMTDTEQNYAQIEKELLAIVFACERFNDYIYGRNVVHVEIDHKPLESIFKKEIHIWHRNVCQCSASRAMTNTITKRDVTRYPADLSREGIFGHAVAFLPGVINYPGDVSAHAR